MAIDVVEWGDFECPYCQNAYPELKELCRRFGDRVTFTWRHFPLWEKHPHALIAAQAAEAARAQGQFHAMHDLLFEHQRQLEREDLIGYATQLGLDVDRFTTELDNETYLARVREERAEGEAIGVSGTPTLFIGGELYQGFYDAEALSEEIAMRGA